MDSKNNIIEIIDLEDEDEKNCPANFNAKAKLIQANKETPQSAHLPEITNAASIITKTISNSALSKPNKPSKTLALIPIDYLKYCEVKNGKFTVNLDTLNRLKVRNSVLLCKMPQEVKLNQNETNSSGQLSPLISEQNFLHQQHGQCESLQSKSIKLSETLSMTNSGKLVHSLILKNPPPLRQINKKTEKRKSLNSTSSNEVNRRISKSKKYEDSDITMKPSHLTNKKSRILKDMKFIKEPFEDIYFTPIEKDPLDLSQFQSNYIDKFTPVLSEGTSNRVSSEMQNNMSYKDGTNEPLGGLSNIFEPIVTLNELNEEHFPFGKPLPKCANVHNIPSHKAETKNQNDDFSPVTVMQSQHLKCLNQNNKKRANKKPLLKDKKLITKLKDNGRVLSQTTSDQCRYFYLKRSAWYKLDPLSKECKGFNEREKYSSTKCLAKFSSYIIGGKNTPEKLLNKIGQDVENCTSFSECANGDDLYYTKKIEIVDRKGRKIRTEYIHQLEKHPKRKKYENRYRGSTSKTSEPYNETQKLSGPIEYMLTKTRPCHVIIERSEIAEKKIKNSVKPEKITTLLETKFSGCRALRKNSYKPMLILNKKNILSAKLDHRTCTRSNVVFVKKTEEKFPEQLYKNDNLVKLINNNLIKITSPKVLQSYFALEDVI